MQTLSVSGKKVLSADSLREQLAFPSGSSQDQELLQFLNSEVLSHSVRIDDLEKQSSLTKNVVEGIQRTLLEVEFGQLNSQKTSLAVGEISISLPPLVRLITDRPDVVNDLKSRVSKHGWVSVHGGMGCGKTQLAALLGNKLSSCIYVSLRDLSADECDFQLQSLMHQLGRDLSTFTGGIRGLDVLPQGTVIIFDDLPRLLIGDRFSSHLLRLISHASATGKTILTLTHFRIPETIVSQLDPGLFFEMKAPDLSDSEALELFRMHGVPSDAVTMESVSSLVNTARGNPTLLAAMARMKSSSGWENTETFKAEANQSVATGELVEQTIARLLKTVENQDHRELLYRLCVISGPFGEPEIQQVSLVNPEVSRIREACAKLDGLWIEKQSDHSLVVCPLISAFGASELSVPVERAVANALASLIFQSRSVTPISFTKGLLYLRRAKNGSELGLRLYFGFQEISDLPELWQRLLLRVSLSEGLFDDCPDVIEILVKSQQISLAHSLGLPITEIVRSTLQLIEGVDEKSSWAVVGLAVQSGPLIATEDFDEGMRLLKHALRHLESFLNTTAEHERNSVGTDATQPVLDRLGGSLPWIYASSINTAERFSKWFNVLLSCDDEQIDEIFSSELAPEGFKLLLDRVWLSEHEKEIRNLQLILEIYDNVQVFVEKHCRPLFMAIVARSKIIVLAEYMSDLPKAVLLASESLSKASGSDESKFLIYDTIGRQYLYHKRTDEAVGSLRLASTLDTGTFDGVRCRTFMELSRAIGDQDSHEALLLTEKAIDIARRSPLNVSPLDLVSALGEAAIAASKVREYERAFLHCDEAFVNLESCDEHDTVEWKMRFVILGNTLGYLTSMASTGKPPAEDYTVPPRGAFLGYNILAANWYDSNNYSQFNLAPTTLVMFANAVGNHKRAVYWANTGLDDARKKGVWTCVHTLAEALVPTLLQEKEYVKALDYAYESSVALQTSVVFLQLDKCKVDETNFIDLSRNISVDEILGQKPGEHWNHAEDLFFFHGVFPSILSCLCGSSIETDELLLIKNVLDEMALSASNPNSFTSASESLHFFLNTGNVEELRSRAMRGTGSNSSGDRVVALCLLSMAYDTDLKLSVICHALIMHILSNKTQTSSPTWRFITDRLVDWWNLRLKESRFLFSNPAHIEVEFIELIKDVSGDRVKKLIRLTISSLGVKLPEQLQEMKAWIYN